MQRAIHVLITGVGAPGVRGTIYALRSNREDFCLHVTGVDMRPDVVGRFLVDSFYPVPPPEDPSYTESLVHICSEESIDIVIPQTTREVNILSQQVECFSTLGVRVMVSNWPAIQVAKNKSRLLQAFERIRLPVPLYRLVPLRG